MATPQLVDPSAFLCLLPSHWWNFKNTAAVGSTARVECASQQSGQVLVKVTLGSQITEHLLNVLPTNSPGYDTLQYQWLYSVINGQRSTWGEGLLIPANWKVGDSISATSKEGNPLTGNPVRITLTLTKSGIASPPAGTSYPPNTQFMAMDVHQLIVDSKLSTKVAEGTISFALGLGPYAAQGQNFGVFYLLGIQSWGGGGPG